MRRLVVKLPGWAGSEGRPKLARAAGTVGSVLLFVAIGLVVTVSTRGTGDLSAPLGKEGPPSYSHFSYFPIIQKNHPAQILNCGFETGDLTYWQTGGGLVVGTVSSVWKDGPCLAGRYCGRLGGDDKVYPGNVPVDTYGGIWQTFRVPTATEVSDPQITLRYRVFSHDRVYDRVNDRYYDDFEVSVNVALGAITKADRHSRGCNVCSPYPTTMTLPVIGAGLLFCGGNRTCSRPMTDIPDDTGWLTVTLQLDPGVFSGQDITLYLANWNRRTRDFNTWTYVDDVCTNW